jgi:hypothetical protein
MRATFHAELDELITDLAIMTRLVTQMMTTASTALHQTDPTLADLVIAHGDQMTTMHDNTQQRCVTLLTLQAPAVAWPTPTPPRAPHPPRRSPGARCLTTPHASGAGASTTAFEAR